VTHGLGRHRRNLEADAAELAMFERIDREGLFKLPGPTYDNDFERRMATAFRPKIIHWGHTAVESSIVTAIVNKNPFCLLDLNFFNISF
jgi:hypothetical protein